MKEENIKEIYNYLFEFISIFHQNFGSVFRKQYNNSKYKCNKNQNKAIMIIGKKKKVTPTTLGKCLDMRKGSLTTLIDSLENMDLVRRKTDEKDRRRIWLSLTEEGMNYLELKKKEFEDSIIKYFSKLSEDETQEFASNMKKMVNVMRNLGGHV